jgi:hypothetical protein
LLLPGKCENVHDVFEGGAAAPVLGIPVILRRRHVGHRTMACFPHDALLSCRKEDCMKLRLVLLLFASLAVASLASAQGGCLDCVSGTCQQSADGLCDKTCCNRPVGVSCVSTMFTLECAARSPVPFYFTSRMPQHTEGSLVRLQYAPAVQAPPLKCGAAVAVTRVGRKSART